MRTLTLALIACLAPVTVATAQESAEDAAVEAYESALDVWQVAQKDHRKAYSRAKTDEERNRIWSDERPNPDLFAPAFMEVASTYPGTKVALDCLGWIAGNAADAGMISHVIEIVMRDHLGSEDLGSFVDHLARCSDPAAERALQTILSSSPHHDVRGKACYQLGMKKLSAAKLARRIQEAGEEELDTLKSRYTEVAFTRAKGLQPQIIQAVGEKLLERVVSEFGDVKGRRRTLGRSAAAELFEIRKLQIGMIAPEIEGVGIYEKPMKLSEFRGKVVLLDFWGDW